jgi:hypothetical protein
MKTTIVSVVLIAMIACVCLAQSQPAASKHEPNSGFVSDEVTAKDIAKVVLSRLLTPEVFSDKPFSDAGLTNGVWTVHCWGPKTDINVPLTIQIRQNTGAIIRYVDPNA